MKAAALVPLAVYGLQNLLGWWPEGEAARDYHRHIDGRWLMMELATLAAGAVMLWRFRLPFLVMPVAVTLWYLSMDLAPLLAGSAPTTRALPARAAARTAPSRAKPRPKATATTAVAKKAAPAKKTPAKKASAKKATTKMR